MSDFTWAMTQLRQRKAVEVRRKGSSLQLRRVATTAWVVKNGSLEVEYIPSKEDRAARDWELVTVSPLVEV